MCNDADNFHPFRLRRADADENALADRRLARVSLFGQQLVDNYQVPSGGVVRVRERAAREQRRTHNLKVARKYDLKIHSLKFAGVGERFLSTPADGAEASSQRKRKRGRNALDARDGLQALLNLVRKRGAFFRCLSFTVPEYLKSQETARVEAGVDALQLEETPEHQSRSGEQHK